MSNLGFIHIVEEILLNLDYSQLRKCMDVNKSWKLIFKNPSFWLRRFRRLEELWKRNDFRTLKILEQGVFGSVSLVRNKHLENIPTFPPNDSNGTASKISRQNLFAMKTLNKTNVRQKKQVGHVIAERDILSEGNNDWIVKLQGSFQVRIFLNILLKQY